MITTEWWEHKEMGRTIVFNINHKMMNPGVEGDATVEVSVELWHQVLDLIGYTPLDGPPSLG